ncbi:hypothetical protein ACTQ49_05425 [Luteococcus sp. Sow4_B9]|uniref:hypothetical protein n=1 Tax=Luteococcus sp. Sow4_B9 TaxID=3438792 RepID=UPI003F951EF4
MAKKIPAKVPAEIAAWLVAAAMPTIKDPKTWEHVVQNETVQKYVAKAKEKFTPSEQGPVKDQVEHQLELVEQAMAGYADFPELQPPVEDWRRRMAQLRMRAPLVDGLAGKQRPKEVKRLLRDSNQLILDVTNFGLGGEEPARRRVRVPGLRGKTKRPDSNGDGAP